MRRPYVPPITREQFLQHAKPIPLTVGGLPFDLQPDESVKGSLYWRFSQTGPWNLLLPDKIELPCVATFTVTILGSNGLPQ